MKYRIKQIGDWFYPQYELFFIYKNFYKQVYNSSLFSGKYLDYEDVVRFLSLDDAKYFIEQKEIENNSNGYINVDSNLQLLDTNNEYKETTYLFFYEGVFFINTKKIQLKKYDFLYKQDSRWVKKEDITPIIGVCSSYGSIELLNNELQEALVEYIQEHWLKIKLRGSNEEILKAIFNKKGVSQEQDIKYGEMEKAMKYINSKNKKKVQDKPITKIHKVDL